MMPCPLPPDLPAGIAKVAAIYVPVSVVEFLVYVPMLGAGASYLTFITGNVTNLKIPCAINSRDIAKVADNSPESEIISTLSVATSALVTMAVIFCRRTFNDTSAAGSSKPGAGPGF